MVTQSFFDYLQHDEINKPDIEQIINRIDQKTCAYAKSQEVFFRMFKRTLALYTDKSPKTTVQELNLTLSDPRLYINQIVLTINHAFKI